MSRHYVWLSLIALLLTLIAGQAAASASGGSARTLLKKKHHHKKKHHPASKPVSNCSGTAMSGHAPEGVSDVGYTVAFSCNTSFSSFTLTTNKTVETGTAGAVAHEGVYHTNLTCQEVSSTSFTCNSPATLAPGDPVVATYRSTQACAAAPILQVQVAVATSYSMTSSCT
jgi:hypothetical protein